MDKKQFLAMSLPYRLKIEDSLFRVSMTGINGDDYYFGRSLTIEDVDDIVPILRPLSDLDKQITHAGETFIPIERIGIYNPKNVDYLIDQILSEFVEYSVMETLVRWHFDVIGLIPRGEAIDINTLSGNIY